MTAIKIQIAYEHLIKNVQDKYKLFKKKVNTRDQEKKNNRVFGHERNISNTNFAFTQTKTVVAINT